ncbi:filamentous hemagglutinin N-terminal domain-containing protein [Nostoc sp. FACHB-280]|uniref:two-partner secretion domain-containing protein n=1 Tax=Nostoc sp. FACHB-280 TaxID=2692839 RepID=UPI00168AD848|nr:filamentous hemagglutinin N-terminal domain-containing protein [Nostoc sp. FACHB-280]MBD2495352.1 filamentous hemagglutinin N-terminal domain-containing protein [Nostoc sp. FACHB-280]
MINNPQWRKYLHLGFVGFLGVVGVTIFSPETDAQSKIVPDNTLEAESSQIIPNFNGLPIEVVTGGATRGINLFHSFQEFNVSAGRGAYFFVPSATIQNVLARVTGNHPSEILGTLGTFGRSQPNLYLINPNGIIFGRNATLNVGGSFVATTANAIQFPGGAEFSMSSPVTPGNSLLSVHPTAFLFNQIANQGANSIENRGSLLVPNHKSLILLGGRVAPTSESTGQIFMDGGRVGGFNVSRIEIGGLNAPGSVGIKVDGDKLSLNFPQGIARPDIKFVNNSAAATLDIGGDVVVNAHNFSLINNSNLLTSVSRPGNVAAKSGDISINATGNVTLAENSQLTNGASESGNTGNINIFANGNISLTDTSDIGNIALKTGDTGNINIIGRSLNINNGSSIQAIATEGNSGAINIIAGETVSLAGRDIGFITGTLIPSAIISNVSSIDASTGNSVIKPTSGTSSGVNIKAQNLALADGAIISAANRTAGDSGNIKLQVHDSVLLNGAFITSSNLEQANAGDIFITSDRLSLINNSRIESNTFGIGNGGNININSRDIQINNSAIEATVVSFPGIISDAGNAGNINIKTERILLTNLGLISTSSDQPEPGEKFGVGGDINITATDLIEIDAQENQTGFITGITSRTFSNSRGGDITLNTKNLIVRNGGFIAVDAGNNLGGDAGNIFIISQDEVLVKNNSAIRANARQSNGGTINITAKKINLQNNGDIRTELSSGNGRGGNIFLTADTIIALADSDILAFAPEGQGGDITFNTRAVFSDSLFDPQQKSTNRASIQSLNNNRRSDINASGAISGNIIGVPDVSFIQNGLTELQNNFIDTNALIANSCIARSSKTEGSFIITGTTGLPTRPGEAVASSYPTGDVQNVSSSQADNSWQKGDPIVEPEGVYRLANGNLVMSRECSKF